MAGAWQSECVDSGTGQGFRLSFVFGKQDIWDLDYDVFADPACAQPFLTVAVGGTYTLGAESTAAMGAREGNFTFARRTVTPKNEAAAGFLKQACGQGEFSTGSATEILAGCSGLGVYPVADCTTDHDIVSLQGDTLYLGMRPKDNDMCTPQKRPSKLGLPLKNP